MKEIRTRNEKWGFYGAIKVNGKFNPAREWANAVAWVRKAMPMWNDDQVRLFLDAKEGRHLANDAYNAGGVTNVDSGRWLAVFYEFCADQPDFLSRAEVAKINEARKQVRAAMEKLRLARKTYREVCDSEKASDSPSRKLIFAELRKETEPFETMMS